MRTRVLIAAMGISVTALSQALDTGAPADATRRPIPEAKARIDTQEPAEVSQDRQPGWVDENAIPSASRLPAPSTQDPQISPSAPDIRRFLTKLTDMALSPGGVRRATGLLDERDRVRIEEDLQNLPDKPHDDVVRDFRAQWKARYGNAFDLSRQQILLDDYLVLRGLRPAEEAILASNQLRPPRNHPTSAPAGVSASGQQDTSATIVVPGNPDLKQPAIVLKLANQSVSNPDWRLDVPDTLEARRLQSILDERLNRLIDGRQKWPATTAEAYRLVTYSVLASFNDQPVDRPADPPQPPKPPSPDNPSIPS